MNEMLRTNELKFLRVRLGPRAHRGLASRHKHQDKPRCSLPDLPYQLAYC